MSRGRLKVFLGYAAGVGKTYQMLTEARERVAAGEDLVVAYFEPHARPDTMALIEGLEIVPRRVTEYRGSRFEEMDADAVIARRPKVAVVDEFAHSNVPGSKRARRWQDVEAILDAGIDVLTSLNIQHIESLNDQVWHVTGIRVRETVPDWTVREAAEVVMVDVTPRALIHRLERGVVYSKEKAAKALENFFTETNLAALRELAMRQTAQQLEAPEPARQQTSREKLLLWITPSPSAAMLIRRGRRVADFLDSPCSAVCVAKDAAMSNLTVEEKTAIEGHLNFCRNLRIAPLMLEGEDPPATVVAYARSEGVTQILAARNTPGIRQLVDLARDMQVMIVAERVRHP